MSQPPDKPISSPRPDYPPELEHETPTNPGLRPVLERYERRAEERAKLEAEGLIAEAGQALQRKGVWALIVLVGLVAMGAVTAMGQVMDRAEKKGADAGREVVRDVVQEQKYLRQDVDHVTKKTERVEKLVELMARKLKVSESAIPDPVPEPPPRDGGR